MADRIGALTIRVQIVEEKVDRLSVEVTGLSTTVRELSASVDRRFDEVSVALVEQRQYTEFAFSTLQAEMRDRFDKVDGRFAQVDGRFDRLEAKMNGGFSRVERKLDQFIDTQIQTNQLVDRRLRALEQAPDRE